MNIAKEGLTDFEEAVLEKLKQVPGGQVTTYGELARAVGRPRAMRAVGNALNKNPYAPDVPCHRVVRSDGRLGGFARGVKKKIILLEGEGVKTKSGKVVNFNEIIYKF